MKEFFHSEKDKNIKQSIPEPALRRLPRYVSYLKALEETGVKHVTSSIIADNFKMDATLVTKDLSYTGVKGRTKIGYKITELIEAIIQYLYFNSTENAYLFGVGNLGKALIQYESLKKYGLNIVAGFDIDKNLVNNVISDIKVYHVNEFREVSNKLKAMIGIITTPDSEAQNTSDIMIAWGVKVIWNLTPKSIKVPDNIEVVTTSIYSDLAVIRHKLSNM